jgi:hypothetical protein
VKKLGVLGHPEKFYFGKTDTTVVEDEATGETIRAIKVRCKRGVGY